MTDRILLYPTTFKTFFVVPVVTIVSGAEFPDWEQPARVKQPQTGYVTSVGLQPVQTFVFSSFSQPTAVKPLQTQQGFVGDLGPASTPPWFVFSSFSQPVPATNNLRVFEQPTIVFETEVPFVQPYVFGQFDQPQFKRPPQDIPVAFVYPTVTATITPSSLVFLPFDLPQVKKPIQDQWVQFTVQQEPPFVLTPIFTGFTDFGMPIQRKPIPPDVSGTLQPQVVAVVQPYVFSKFEQPTRVSFQTFPQSVQFSLTPPVVVVQPYVFSPFEQPQFRRQISESPSRFIGSVTYQPYVFSTFSQPGRVNYQYFPQSVQYALQPYVVVPPPVFTGFMDFGLAQQLIGTQRRQDGSSVDFRVLSPTFVASPLVFYGFYDFGLRPAPTSFRVYEQPQVTSLIAIPPPTPLEAAFAGKRWKYQETKKTPEPKKKEPKVIPLESSNLVDMAYDEEAKELKIQFKTYKYEAVPPKKAKGLLKAESHGKYFHKNIKNKHPTTLIKTRTK